MSTDRADPTGCAPVLVVADVPASLEHYGRTLGFEKVFEWGEPVTYGGVCRGEVLIHLQAAQVTERPRGGSCLSIFVGDALATHRDLVDRGARIVAPPAERDYGLIDFSVEDPDGNTLVFGSVSSPTEPPAGS